MRLGTVTLSESPSTAFLSGCSFIGGQLSQFKNRFSNQKAAKFGRYAAQGGFRRSGTPASGQFITTTYTVGASGDVDISIPLTLQDQSILGLERELVALTKQSLGIVKSLFPIWERFFKHLLF